jgi:hypothetical protein
MRLSPGFVPVMSTLAVSLWTGAASDENLSASW